MRHGEAFALMTYRCNCGHREVIWNSRDGVTPFCLACPSCGRMTLQHVDRRNDQLAPDHKLFPGQRFFRDGTAEEAMATMKKRVKARRLIQDVSQETEEEMLEWATEGEFQKGWPTVDRR